MKKLLLSVLLWYLAGQPLSAQVSPLTIFRNPQDSTTDYYTLILPGSEVKGMLVFTYQEFSEQLKSEARLKGIALLNIVPSAHYPDILTEDYPLEKMDEILTEVTGKYPIPLNRLVAGGMSAAGTLAIRYAQYAEQGRLKSGIHLAGVMAVDPPLDYERFWKECRRKVDLNFHPAAVAEGRMILNLFDYRFGGTPYQKLSEYQSVSPFSSSAPGGGNARWLRKIPVRIYHEPDVNWWIENRRQDYHGMNSIDAAALINQLLINGNAAAELISTHNRGFREDGTRHPHSWSIVDEPGLIVWCLSLF